MQLGGPPTPHPYPSIWQTPHCLADAGMSWPALSCLQHVWTCLRGFWLGNAC